MALYHIYIVCKQEIKTLFVFICFISKLNKPKNVKEVKTFVNIENI